MCVSPGIDGLSVAASAVTAGSGLSAGAIRTKASNSSATTRGYGGGGDPLDRHQSTDEEDRDLDLSGDNDRDLDLDEHPTQVTTPPPPPPSPSLPLPPDCITSSVFSSSSGGESKTQTRPTRQLSQQWSPRHTYRGYQQVSSSVVQPSRQCTDHHQHG